MIFDGYSFVLITSLLIIKYNHVKADLVDIIGGIPADIRQFPYQVSLRIDGQFMCGGIIINERHILTAAHCVCAEDYSQCPVSSDRYTVVAGSTTLDPILGAQVAVEKIFVHERYLVAVYANDIAVLRLSQNLQFNGTIQAYPLADSTPRDGTECTASGWGKTSIDTEVPSNTLMSVNLSVIGHNECARTNNIFYKVLCTDRGPKKPWSGDSGGALNCEGKIAGIVSAGYITNDYPNYFTDIARYRSWIAVQLHRETSTNVTFNFPYFIYAIVARLVYSNIRRRLPILMLPLMLIYHIFRIIFFWLPIWD